MKDSQVIAMLAQLKANTKQLQKQSETFVHAMERLEGRIDKRFEEVNQLLTEMNQRLTDMQAEIRNDKNGSPNPKPLPPTRLAVTMPNGTVVNYKNASDTFVEVISKLGAKQVKNLGIKINRTYLMSTSKDDQQRRKVGGYYINVGISTKRKKKVLEEIAYRFDVELKVEIIPK